jgi:hypothetical protein
MFYTPILVNNLRKNKWNNLRSTDLVDTSDNI